MGLDFTLYKKRKDVTSEEFFNQDFDEYSKYELAYGRKSWELVHKLATKEDINNGEGILTKERWNEFINELSEIGPKLDEIKLAFSHEENAEYVTYPELLFTIEDKKLINEYQLWYRNHFGDVPILGYYFSVGYMSSFWDARDTIEETLDDPEYEVLMTISY